jgi:DNA polymerase-3 subunit delta
VPGLTTERDVLLALESGRAEPVYLLVGDDEVGKTRVLDALAALVPGPDRAFGLQDLYANEVGVVDVVAAVRTLALLGGRRIVVLHRAELWLKGRGRASGEDEPDARGPVADDAGEPSGSMAALEEYVASPVVENCLAIVAADVNRSTRLAKLLLKHAAVVEFWGLKTDREVRGRDLEDALRRAQRFVEGRVREAGLAIAPDAIEPLVEHAGTDIATLRNDVDLVITYCLGRKAVTADDVAAVVSGAVSLDDFAVTRAIERGNAAEALRQVALALDGGSSPYAMLGQLGWFVRSVLPRLSPGRVPGAVEALFRTDQAMKSSGGDPRVLLERLVVVLCGETGRRAGTARPDLRGR